VKANVYVEGIWNGANLRARMAHTANLQDWFPIDSGEFPPISANGEHTIEYIQPARFHRIEYWLEHPDKFTLIQFYVEIDPQENPIGEYEGRTDILDEQIAITELFAFGEGIRVEEKDADG
jgi:hypothetical protein